ncbi:alcohol dehydrogenase catalytic domain-containing protein [Alteribacillus sp. YIM 98480]|uniref:zinc-binding dehydrogenase n=1 Tax=Alteribacillus sp. YIM 98480 TaxID=2606599 RepID=UPI00131CB967|nr:alcohol dehydrogenase catalytic domain-containing protein [Alteribacillus sp. YIM 98480]
MQGLVRYGTEIGHFRFETGLAEPTIGEDDILVEVKAAGICGADLKHYGIENDAAEIPENRRIAGHEFAGVIVETGKNVTDWKVGDRVVSENTGDVCGKCHACSKGNFLVCPKKKSLGLTVGWDGGFTKYVRIPGKILEVYKNAIFHIPDNVSFEEAAILDPMSNAYMALAQRSQLLPGENVVIFGAGPLGLFSVQIAKLMGAANIILVASKRNEHVRFKVGEKLGVTHFVVNDEENVVESVKNITGENGVGVIVDCAGPPEVLKQSLEIIRTNGQIVRVGMSFQPVDFSINDLSMNAITLTGHMAYDTTSLKNCLTLLEKGMIDAKSMITHRLPISKWEEGFELFANRDAIKVILKYDEEDESGRA